MYYGSSLDMEVKATLAANAAVSYADPLIPGGSDDTAPTVWLPQRLPWNPGGRGGGSLWGYPGGEGLEMSSDFWIWTFAYDVSGMLRVDLKYRIDADGTNPLPSDQNETYAGGGEVGPWQTEAMTRRIFPKGDFFDDPEIDFPVLPNYIADEYYIELTGLSEVLIDYYVEAEDSLGNIKKSPIQHVWIGQATGGGAHVIDGDLDEGASLISSSGDLNLYADWDGEYLYVAAEGVGSTPGSDHFIIIGTDLSSPLPAPWAKTGTVAGRVLYLGNEDSNNWCGWFDAGEDLLSSDVSSASGEYLEGIVRLGTYLGDPIPDGVYLALATYDSPDGGTLQQQVPPGNGNGNVEEPEYVFFPFTTSHAEPYDPGGQVPGLPQLLPFKPNPFDDRTSVEFDLPRSADLTIDVYDVRGRRIRNLASGRMSSGLHTIVWDGNNFTGRKASPGIYFVRLSAPGFVRTGKIVLMR
jgi:hypothetical protein